MRLWFLGHWASWHREQWSLREGEQMRGVVPLFQLPAWRESRLCREGKSGRSWVGSRVSQELGLRVWRDRGGWSAREEGAARREFLRCPDSPLSIPLSSGQHGHPRKLPKAGERTIQGGGGNHGQDPCTGPVPPQPALEALWLRAWVGHTKSQKGKAALPLPHKS